MSSDQPVGRPVGYRTTKRGKAAGGVRVTVLLSAHEAGLLNADARRGGHKSRGKHLREVWLAVRGPRYTGISR